MASHSCGTAHPDIWDRDCPWDGKTRSSGEPGGSLMSSRPLPTTATTTTTTPGLRWLSLTEFLCVGGHKNSGWGPGGQMTCWAPEAGHGGPLTQSLLCPPLAAGLHSYPSRSFPSTTTAAHLLDPSHPTPGKGAPGGAKQRLQGSSSKEGARERLGNGLDVLGVWVGLMGHGSV